MKINVLVTFIFYYIQYEKNGRNKNINFNVSGNVIFVSLIFKSDEFSTQLSVNVPMRTHQKACLPLSWNEAVFVFEQQCRVKDGRHPVRIGYVDGLCYISPAVAMFREF